MQRRRPGEGKEVTVTIDEKGELGGYANYAHRRVANAVVSDVIRTVQAVEMGAGSGLNTAYDCGCGRGYTCRARGAMGLRQLVGQTVPRGHASAGDNGRRARLTRVCHIGVDDSG